jgi:hypothetical protein
MKQTLLVAVASAAIGAATAVLLTDPTAAPARAPGPARLSTVDLERAFVRALETAGLGRPTRPRPATAPSGPSGRAEPSPSSAPSESSTPERSPDESATPIRDAYGRHALPEANVPELSGLRSFRHDPELRLAWMFRPAREVIAWLGSPNHAFALGGGESWVYKLPDGTKRVLEFARGRLLNIQR